MSDVGEACGSGGTLRSWELLCRSLEQYARLCVWFAGPIASNAHLSGTLDTATGSDYIAHLPTQNPPNQVCVCLCPTESPGGLPHG